MVRSHSLRSGCSVAAGSGPAGTTSVPSSTIPTWHSSWRRDGVSAFAVADVTMSRRYDGATGRVAVDGSARAGRRTHCAEGVVAIRPAVHVHDEPGPARSWVAPAAGRARVPVPRARRTRRTLPGHVRRRCLGRTAGCVPLTRCRRRRRSPTSRSSPSASSAGPTCGRSREPSPSSASPLIENSPSPCRFC